MSLDKRSRLITYFIACGIGIGVPTIVGVLDAWVFNNLYFLLFPVPFLIIMYFVWLFAPIALGIRAGELHIVRRISPVIIKLEDVKDVKIIENLRQEAGWVMRTGGSGGAWGYFGFFWSKKWKTFKMHATDFNNLVLIDLINEKKIVVSPDQKEDFVKNLINR